MRIIQLLEMEKFELWVSRVIDLVERMAGRILNDNTYEFIKDPD